MPGKLPLRRWAPWLIALAGLAAYANSLTGVFVLDDQRWIVESSPLRQLWPPSSSRPLVHLTLALNYAWSGLAPWSYHIVNLVIHVLAGLTLYGLARRTLPHEPAESAAGLAASVALLWLVHPIQTESVTYVIQRAESLMGLFYLLTLYCAARGPGWEAGAVLACLAGMLTKPTMVTAPLAVVVCDHAFWGRHRWKFYAALAATWLALAWALRAGAGDWERSAGYGFQAVSALDYAMSQPAVIMHYLRLMVWPHPLCLDYAWPVGVSWPATVAVAVALAATGWSLWRRPAAGAVAALFWLTLAPSSSFIPINDLAFEHRMYLPSAAVMAGVVWAGRRLPEKMRAVSVAGLAGALLVTTASRNADYRSAVAIWQQTTECAPHNARAHLNLGKALEESGDAAAALKEYGEAVRLKPRDARARYNLGTALAQAGQAAAAVEEFRAALALHPDYREAHYNLALALQKLGRDEEARQHLAAAGLTASDALGKVKASEGSQP
jgi:tetratricopeptide (TPR) repeat protein